MAPAFKAFLSHRYKSPATNLFFFNLFADKADVEFEVDEGVKFGDVVRPLPTNVTRIERMVRDANAFKGIYPLSLEPTESAAKLQRSPASFAWSSTSRFVSANPRSCSTTSATKACSIVRADQEQGEPEPPRPANALQAPTPGSP